MSNPKIILISGPTASGKTKLALDLAKQFNGEIISADSRQVYQDMDIVTGKDIPSKSKFNSISVRGADLCSLQDYNLGFYLFDNIPVYGLDLVKPNQNFDVSDFVKITRFLISQIQDKNKLPIIVGGTAFWLKNLLSPAATIGVPTNSKLRQELEELTLVQLQDKLKKLNPDKYNSLNNSDVNNPRRLIRAIEVCRHSELDSGSNSDLNKRFRNKFGMTSLQPKTYNLKPNYSFWLSLNPNPQSLQTKISKRVEERITDGAIEETQKLVSKYSWDLPSMSAIGYKDLRFYLEKKQTLEEIKKLWILHEIQYAKRQLTFLKKILQLKWFDLQESGSYDKINSEINKFLHN